MAAFWVVERLLYWNGMPLLPSQVMIWRLLAAPGLFGASGSVRPATPVVVQVEPASTPVRTQEASQLGVLALTTLPNESKPRLLAVTRPVQPPLGL
jgi:hypothetical protein